MVLSMKQLKLIKNVHRICYQSSKVNYWIQRKIHQNMNLSALSKSWNGHGDHFICPLHNQRIIIENYMWRGDGRYRIGWVTSFNSPFKSGGALVIILQMVVGHQLFEHFWGGLSAKKKICDYILHNIIGGGNFF